MPPISILSVPAAVNNRIPLLVNPVAETVALPGSATVAERIISLACSVTALVVVFADVTAL